MADVGARTPLEEARDAWKRRDHYEAAKWINHALDGGPEGSALAHIRLTAGVIYRELGDTSEALKHLRALIDEWDRYPESKHLSGYALYNLALAHRQRREYAQAIDCYRLAVIDCRLEGLKMLECRALQNLAWALCLTGETDEAVQCLEGAELVVESQEDYWHQRIGYAFCSFVDGDYGHALDCTRAIMEKAEAPTEVLAQAAWLAGKVQLRWGDVNAAWILAEAAIDLAVKAKDPRLMNDANALRKEVYSARGVGA